MHSHERLAAMARQNKLREEARHRRLDEEARARVRGTAGDEIDRLAAFLRERFPAECAAIDTQDDEAVVDLAMALLARLSDLPPAPAADNNNPPLR